MSAGDTFLADAAATGDYGARLAGCLTPGLLVFLQGELGAGKTTLVRGLLQALGHRGAVKSPTYTLVESYRLPSFTVHHLDLYRLGDPEELEWLGIRDLLAGDALCLVEWPARGAGVLPGPDLVVNLDYAGDGRRVRIQAFGEAAGRVRDCLNLIS